MFSIESPNRGDSNEYTQHTIFNIKKIALNYSKSTAIGFFSKGLKKEFEISVVNELSVFEPLKVYCIHYIHYQRTISLKPYDLKIESICFLLVAIVVI